jgi:hypothetical protein
LLACRISALHRRGVIRGNIAIPSPKRRRELPPDLPVNIENVRSPQQIAKERRRQALPWGVHR